MTGRTPERQVLESLLAEIFSLQSDISVVHLWRGQADARWLPQPTLYRRLLARYRPDQVTENLVTRYETDLFCEANGRGFYKGSRLDTLVALQHHGGATRFLDITRNPLIALWFASDPASADTDGVVYHFGLPLNQVLQAHEVGSWDRLVIPDSAGEVLAYFPRSKDARIRAQQAGFLLTVLDGSLEDRAPFDSDSEGLAVHKVTVPSDVKEQARQHLRDSAGITTVDVYPDFAGFSLANASGAPFARDEDGLYTGEKGLFPNGW
ncbi:MAG TPA: FRG domain-containing protein [Propionicimonas sp.]